MLDHTSAVNHGFTTLDDACWLPLAAKNRLGFGGCDCGGEVVVVGVQALSPRGEVDRRVLTADVLAGLGLITCERNGFDQMAKQQSSWRRSAGGLLIPVIGSAVGVEGGGVEQNDGNGPGTSRSGR